MVCFMVDFDKEKDSRTFPAENGKLKLSCKKNQLLFLQYSGLHMQ
jgi:hypothetical protein